MYLSAHQSLYLVPTFLPTYLPTVGAFRAYLPTYLPAYLPIWTYLPAYLCLFNQSKPCDSGRAAFFHGFGVAGSTAPRVPEELGIPRVLRFQKLPIVSIVVPFFGLTNFVSRILKGNPKKELQWRL